MRYCNNCQRITAGDPLFCNSCGRSFDEKLCPSRHVNPRSALVCGTCGSRDLSTPHPKLPIWLKLVTFFFSHLPGILLLLVSIAFFCSFLNGLIYHPQLLGQFLSVGFLLAVLWWMYLQLPHFIQHGLKRLFRSSHSKRNDHRH